MSALVMGLVWELPETQLFGRAEKYILLAYADHADSYGKNIYPSIDLVSKKTFYEERSVQSTTRRLESMGLLIDDGIGPRGTNRWRIPISFLPDGGAKIAPVQNEMQKIAPEGIAPEPSVVVKTNQRDSRFSEIAQSLALLSGGALNSTSADLISTWLEKHTNEWILRAIELAKVKGANSANYVDTILIRWEANGYPKSRAEKVQTVKNEKSERLKKTFDAIDQALGA
jgi:DnaD/phage-associated family protein